MFRSSLTPGSGSCGMGGRVSWSGRRMAWRAARREPEMHESLMLIGVNLQLWIKRVKYPGRPGCFKSLAKQVDNRDITTQSGFLAENRLVYLVGIPECAVCSRLVWCRCGNPDCAEGVITAGVWNYFFPGSTAANLIHTHNIMQLESNLYLQSIQQKYSGARRREKAKNVRIKEVAEFVRI